MIVIFDPKTDQIIGHASRVFDSGKFREPTIDEVCPDHLERKLESLYLPDEPRYLMFGPEHYRLRRDETGAVVGIQLIGRISVSCDATDHDGDQIPDIPADGTSTTVITAELEGGSADVEVAFRTTRGSLSRRSAKTDDQGKATVTLRAATETVPATVSVTAVGYRPGSLTVEFLPPDEPTGQGSRKNPVK
jgi:hypothetical protein